MAFSFAIPIGLLIALVGATLLVPARSRKIGVVVLGVGILITLFTIGVIFLVVNSPM